MSAVPQTQSPLPIKNPQAFFIGGKWVKPAGTGKLNVISPVTEQVVMTFPEASPRDVDRRGRGRARGVRQGPVAADVGARARRRAAQGRRAVEGAPARARDHVDHAGRRADQPHALSLGSAAGALRVLRQADPELSARRRAQGRARRARARREGAGRSRRGDHAVERAARAALLQGRGGPRGRLHDRREARARDAGRRVHPRRVHRSGGLAARRIQPRAGGTRDGRLPDSPSRHRQDQLHGQHRGRQAHRGRRGRAARAHELRARRQVRRDRARRRERRPRAQEPRAVLDADHGPSLLLAHARARARGAQERSARRVRRAP